MTVPAGRCPTCTRPIWRTCPHPLTGQPLRLWPDPTARFIEVTLPTGIARGLGFCRADAPAVGAEITLPGVGSGTVTRSLPARMRYTYWFSDGMGRFLRHWIPEELKTDPTRILRDWEADRRA